MPRGIFIFYRTEQHFNTVRKVRIFFILQKYKNLRLNQCGRSSKLRPH